MTQAFNLSQLANNLNSSGQLDGSDGLFNAVPPANGGTGLTTLGAAGNMLIATDPSTLAAVTMPTFGFRNRIINGAMMIDQRNAGASVTGSSSVDVYPVDRWNLPCAVSSKLTGQQNAGSVTPPAGFSNYLGITSSSAYSVGSTDYFLLQQRVEGLNVADLGWGTASAQSVTLSFWVRSSLTGTFSGAINNSAFNRSYPFSYTISNANTWEQKTITIAGDTSGTWLTTNGIGINLRVTTMGSGSTRLSTGGSWQAGNYDGVTGTTSVVGTSGATFYITGVQLEKGSTATSFDYRPYGTELALCQRYYQLSRSMTAGGNGTTGIVASIAMRVDMRASPTAGQQGVISISDGANDFAQSSGSLTALSGNDNATVILLGNFSGLTASRGYLMRQNNTNAITLSAEL